MKKISFVVESYKRNNKIFDLEDKKLNRDNCHYQYFLLRQYFKELGYDLATSDINLLEDSHGVLYQNIPEKLPSGKDKVRSFLLFMESKIVRPRNFNADLHQAFSKVFTYADEFIDGKKYFKVNFSFVFPDTLDKDLSTRNRLCTLIAANKKQSRPQELYTERKRTIRWFEKNHPGDFDLYGINWDLYAFSGRRFIKKLNKIRLLRKLLASTPSSYRGAVESKNEILKRYRFCIAYENVYGVPGYVCEKIFDAFIAGCIPIYLGAPNVTDHVPKECFIDKRNYPDYSSLYDFMKSMSDWEYLGYLERIESYFKSESAREFTPEYFAETISREVVNQLEG